MNLVPKEHFFYGFQCGCYGNQGSCYGNQDSCYGNLDGCYHGNKAVGYLVGYQVLQLHSHLKWVTCNLRWWFHAWETCYHFVAWIFGAQSDFR